MSTYALQAVQATISGPGGNTPIGATAGISKEGISCVMLEEKSTMTQGGGGAIMHSLHAGRGGRITVRLMKTSPTNAVLNAMYNLQTANPALHGQNVIVVSDPFRGDLHKMELGAFEKHPDIVYSEDGPMNEWVFVGRLDMQLGAGVPDVNG